MNIMSKLKQAEEVHGLSVGDLKALISKAATLATPHALKTEQEESILQLAMGKDVFVSLPTGFGKSLCYIILPCVFDLMRSVVKKSIVIVVSPLKALMKDQVDSICSNIPATYVTDRESTSPSKRKAIRDGDYQVIFISPESLFCGTEWRRLLSTDTYRKYLAAFVIDEAHCIKKW